MKLTKPVLIGAAAVLAAALGGAGVTYAATTPSKVAVCANKTNGGYMRMLEAGHLSKSQFGKCRANEVKVPLTTTAVKGAKGDTGPAGPAGLAPATLVFQRASGVETCTKSASSTASTLVYACTTATPSPSPSPSS